jgi:hypothetical protein
MLLLCQTDIIIVIFSHFVAYADRHIMTISYHMQIDTIYDHIVPYAVRYRHFVPYAKSYEDSTFILILHHVYFFFFVFFPVLNTYFLRYQHAACTWV